MRQKIHFIGVGGSGIGGVAYLASQMGYEVSGCDIGKASSYGQNYINGHDERHIKDVDLVISSPALFYTTIKNPEFEAARNKGKLMTWQEFLGTVLLKNKKVIAIAGTHGKSTTTAMVGKILIDAGLDPVVVLGANVPEWGGTARYGEGEYAVIEADEFNDNFLNYSPEIIVVNNIEFDHPDYFKDMAQVEDSFANFIKRLNGLKILITEKDSLNLKFNLRVWGKHNQKNANMAYLVGKALNISEKSIISSLENFDGIGRRMELIGEYGGIKVFDDYAHHPTAIKSTIAGLRKEFPESKILVIDEPHGYKRTKILLNEYKGVFEGADKVLIGPIFKARDKVDDSITPQMVAQASEHKDAGGYNSFNELIRDLNSAISNSNYDIIVVMGAGKSYLWAREIANNLPKKFSDVTTFRVGGKIKKYFEVKTRLEIDNAIKYARNKSLPIFVLGGGSDLLVSDDDYNGVALKFIKDKWSYTRRHYDYVEFTGYGGLDWDKFVEKAISFNLQGIECLSGIPGTVGGAPIQNIGAYGQELSDTFVSLKAYDLQVRKYVTFTKQDCKFSYRESIFKAAEFWQKYLITSVTLKLFKNGKPEIKYESLQNYLDLKKVANPDLQTVREAVLEIRKTKFEDPKKVGNAGSFFKNPIIGKDKLAKIIKKYPDIKYFETEKGFKMFAGWLIEKAGWKGKKFKSAGVSPNHALILVNTDGKAKAQDIYELSEMIIADVHKKFDIQLEREVQLINF